MAISLCDNGTEAPPLALGMSRVRVSSMPYDHWVMYSAVRPDFSEVPSAASSLRPRMVSLLYW